MMDTIPKAAFIQQRASCADDGQETALQGFFRMVSLKLSEIQNAAHDAVLIQQQQLGRLTGQGSQLADPDDKASTVTRIGVQPVSLATGEVLRQVEQIFCCLAQLKGLQLEAAAIA